jgi:hypothetical protein
VPNVNAGELGWRCPDCGSPAYIDEDRSRLEFTFLQCTGCNVGRLVDSWERDLEWRKDAPRAKPVATPAPTPAPPATSQPEPVPEPTPPAARAGCAACTDQDAAAAFEASRERRVERVIDESHFDIQVTECRCGQRFVQVFTERIDWVNGEDPQDTLVMPISADEQARLVADPAGAVALLERIGADRRFLVHSFPGTGKPDTWWRNGGFMVGPHD